MERHAITTMLVLGIALLSSGPGCNMRSPPPVTATNSVGGLASATGKEISLPVRILTYSIW
ncbi:MAG: hypothetical protein AB7O52_12595 [Planctomycetota bacterium]